MSQLAIVYYSGMGTTHTMAQRLAATAEGLGAEVRLRHVAEIAPDEAVQSVDAWSAHVAQMKDQPVAEPSDLEWADAVIMGSPTRYGHVTSQLQAFLDTLGPLWQQGKLADKVYAAFTSSQTLHGGQETTLEALHTTFAHLGGIIVPPRVHRLHQVLRRQPLRRRQGHRDGHRPRRDRPGRAGPPGHPGADHLRPTPGLRLLTRAALPRRF